MLARSPKRDHKSLPEGARLLGVQGLRALAALLVVWVHSIPPAEAFLGPTRQARFFYWRDFGSCGVDIFFVISGFIVSSVAARVGGASSRKGISAAEVFLRKRITRIYPLYWIITGVMLLAGFSLHQLSGIHSVWWMPTLFLLPTLTYPANPPLLYLGWTLLFEMYFYFVLATFLVMRTQAVAKNASLFLGGMVALGAVFGIRHPVLVICMNPLTLEFILGCLIGMLYQWASATGKSMVLGGKAAALFGIILLASSIFAGPHSAVQLAAVFAGDGCWRRVACWGIPSAFIVGGVVFWAPAMCSFPARLAVLLGDASYSIYLSSIPALWIVRKCWTSLIQPAPDLGVLLGAIWATAFGLACHLLIERPLTVFFHRGQKPVAFQSSSPVSETGGALPSDASVL